MNIEARQCPECGRIFNLCLEDHADEWFNGHDCEVVERPLSASDSQEKHR